MPPGGKDNGRCRQACHQTLKAGWLEKEMSCTLRGLCTATTPHRLQPNCGPLPKSGTDAVMRPSGLFIVRDCRCAAKRLKPIVMRLLSSTFALGLFGLLACSQPQKSTVANAPGSASAAAADTARPLRLEGGSEKLYAGRWVPAELEGLTLMPTTGPQAFLAFTPGQVNRVTGSTGCNSLNGSFELSGTDGIRFSPLATTRRACPPDGNNTEQRLLRALQAANRWGFAEGRLLLLKGNEVVGRFIATPAQTPSDSTAAVNEYIKWKDKFAAGVDFMASGTEPFWSVEIDLDKRMQLKTPDGVQMTAPVPAPLKPADVAATAYRAATESGMLNVVIFDKQCTNDTSGQPYPKTVQVETSNKRYNGCGQWLADYRLHDIWVLRSLNDTAVDLRLPKGAPTLEFNLNTGRVAGHDGCNSINGPLEVKGKTLSLGRTASTLMACNDGGFGPRYRALLMAKELRYRIENLALTLTDGRNRLRFQKVD